MTESAAPACCDRCGGEFRPADLAGGLCAWCRDRVRIHEAKEAARWAVCEACGKRVPVRGNKKPRWCPECREKWRGDAERRQSDRVQAKEGTEWVQRPKR